MNTVQIVRVDGEMPRELNLNLEIERDASLVESLRRKVKRGELHSVTVVARQPDAKSEEPPAKPAARKNSNE